MKLQNDEDSLNRLVKAVWAAAFKVGHRCGSDSATAYEWGCRSQECQDPEEAWKSELDWRIATEGSYHLDISDPESWSKVP